VEENGRPNGEFGGHWAEVVRAYCELMDKVIPYLPPAEQSVYQRLFRLSHVQQSPFTKCCCENNPGRQSVNRLQEPPPREPAG